MLLKWSWSKLFSLATPWQRVFIQKCHELLKVRVFCSFYFWCMFLRSFLLAGIWLVHFACTWRHIFHSNFAIIRHNCRNNKDFRRYVYSQSFANDRNYSSACKHIVENLCHFWIFSRKLLFFVEYWYHFVILFVIFDKNMGNNRNRKARNLNVKESHVIQDGGEACDQNPGPSKMKIDDVSVNFG